MADFITHSLNIEGHVLEALEYHPEHDSIPVILMHGITASNIMWHVGQTPLLSEHFHIYALSLPGHYPAAFPQGHHADELNALSLARVLGKAIRQLVGDRPVILAGHSTGGFAALNLAANAQDLVTAAGVLSISGFAQGRWIGTLGLLQMMTRFGPLGRALFRLNLRVTGLNLTLFKLAIASYSQNKQALFAHPMADATFQNMLPYYQHIDVDSIMQYFYQMPTINIEQDLCKINVPTLVIAGDHDPIVPPQQARLIASKVEGAELVMLPGVGHLPMSEDGETYNTLITDWFTRYFLR